MTGGVEPVAADRSCCRRSTPAPITTFLLLTAFANGCTAMTGVEAVADGVPMFKEPPAKNAARTMVMMASARRHAVRRPHLAGARLSDRAERNRDGRVAAGARRVRRPQPVLLRRAGGDDADPGPRGEHRVCRTSRRWRRSSRAIATCRASSRTWATSWRSRTASSRCSLGAATLIIVFGGDQHRLIPLYMIGVFLSFTLSQTEHVPAHHADARAGLAAQRRHQRLRRAAHLHRADHRRDDEDARRRVDRASC